MNNVDGLISHPQLRTITFQTPDGEVTCVAPPVMLTGEAPCFRAVPAPGQPEFSSVVAQGANNKTAA